MRFMVLVKAPAELDRQLETAPPSLEDLAAMGAFNDALSRDGMLLAAEGLRPTSQGVRMTFAGGQSTAIDGPFTESKEVIAGFWLLEAGSQKELIERMSRAPFTRGESIEIRELFLFDDAAVEAMV
jgi:hypothetical protein